MPRETKFGKLPISLALQFFGDGGGEGDASGADALFAGDDKLWDAATGTGGEISEDAAPSTVEEGSDDGSQKEGEDADAEFARETEKGGRFYDAFQKAMQAAVKGRLRGAEDVRRTADKLRGDMSTVEPMLAELAKRYGKDISDLTGISAAFFRDGNLLREESERTGKSVEELLAARESERRLEALKRENAKLLEKESAREAAASARRKYDALVRQGEAMRAEFPGFDLKAEAKNPMFAALIRAGVPMKNAYISLHADEIMGEAMQYAGDKASEAAVKRIQAKGARPNENGLGGGVPSRTVSIADMTDADLDAIKERVMRGETVTFT